MTAPVFVFVYACAIACLGGCLARIIRYASMPRHLRWEIYPLPHETPERVAHGGSYFEEVDWWTKPRTFNLCGELKAMLPEMLFLRGLWEFNRRIWWRSFPFHFGLYLVIGSGALVGLRAGLPLVASPGMAESLGRFLGRVYGPAALAGATLVVAGALALLAARLTDPALRTYTTAGDLFNLLFFAVTFGVLLAGYLARGTASPGALELLRDLTRFNTAGPIPGILGAGMVLAAGLAAYIPFTHMSHFIAKFFTYHSVRWDDTPNLPGHALERRIAEYLTYRAMWAAPHIGAGQGRSWAEIATHNPARAKQPVEAGK